MVKCKCRKENKINFRKKLNNKNLKNKLIDEAEKKGHDSKTKIILNPGIL